MFRGKLGTAGASNTLIGVAPTPNSTGIAAPSTPLGRALQRAASSSKLLLGRNQRDFDELMSVDSVDDSHCFENPKQKRSGKKKSGRRKTDENRNRNSHTSDEQVYNNGLPSLLTTNQEKQRIKEYSSDEKSTAAIVDQLLKDGEEESESFDRQKSKEQINQRVESKEPGTPSSARRRRRERIGDFTASEMLKQTASAHVMTPRRRSMNATNHVDAPSPHSRTPNSRCGQVVSILSVPNLVDSPIKSESKHSVMTESLASRDGKSDGKSSRRQSIVSASSTRIHEHTSPRRPSLVRDTTVDNCSIHATPRRLSLTGVSLTASTGHISPRRQSSSRRLLMQSRRNSKSRLMTGEESTLRDSMSFAVDDVSARDSSVRDATKFNAPSSASQRRLCLTGGPSNKETVPIADHPAIPRRQSSSRRLLINGKRKSKSNLMIGNDDLSSDCHVISSNMDCQGVGSSSPRHQTGGRRSVRRHSKTQLSMSEDSKPTEPNVVAGGSPTLNRRDGITTAERSHDRESSTGHGMVRRLSLTGTPLNSTEYVPSSPRRRSSNRYLAEKGQQNSPGKVMTTKSEDGSTSGSSMGISIDLSIIDISLNERSANTTTDPTSEGESPKKTSFLRTLVRQASKTRLVIRQVSKTRLTLNSKSKSSNRSSCEGTNEQQKDHGKHPIESDASVVSEVSEQMESDKTSGSVASAINGFNGMVSPSRRSSNFNDFYGFDKTKMGSIASHTTELVSPKPKSIKSTKPMIHRDHVASCRNSLLSR